MDLKRILVAINSPNTRDAAFARGLALARASGAELYVLHAVPVNHAFSFDATERLARMADVRQRADAARVRVHTVEQHGDPAAIIELHANTRGVDLIVMGGDARRGWRRRHRSRVAEAVIRRTDVPTLVVAAGGGADRPAAFGNVLVALDLSPASEDVLDAVMAVTGGDAARLTAMHAVRGVEAADAVHTRGRWMVPEYRTQLLEDARRSLEAAVANVATGIDVRVHVSAGSAARSILGHATTVDADLIAVGRSPGFTLLGSTALRLLRRNDRALLVIPRSVDRGADTPRAA